MPVFNVVINQTLDLPVDPPFTPKSEFIKRPNGEIQAIKDVWRFRGILPADATGPPNLKTQRDAILAAFEAGNASIEFKVDGVTVERIDDTNHVNGAFFRNFDVRENGAEWLNGLEYEFEVFGEKPSAIPNVIFAEYDTVTEENDGLTTFTVNIEARGPGALQYVLGQAPAGAKRIRITNRTKRQQVNATYTIPPEGGAGSFQEITIIERIFVQQGIFPVAHRFGTRTEFPLSDWQSKTPTRVILSGSVTVRPTVGVSIPIPDNLAKYISTNPDVDRQVRKRPESIDTDDVNNNPVDIVTYNFNFEVPFKVTLDEIVAQRRDIPTESFVVEEGEEAPESGFFVPES